MTFDLTVRDYADRAQVKISELTSGIEAQLASGNEAQKELDASIELLDFQECLLDDFNPWSEADTLYWIEYFKNRFALSNAVNPDWQPLILPVVSAPTQSDTSQWATIVSLELLRTHVQNADTGLSNRITALEEYDYSTLIPQSLLDTVASHTTSIASFSISIAGALSQIASIIAGLNAHANDVSKHVSSSDRASWNARLTVAQLTLVLANYAALNHKHAVADVINLNEQLLSLQNQISSIPVARNGSNGITPFIQIGTVTEGSSFSVSLSPSSTLQNPILDFTLVRGEAGQGFHIDAIGNLSGRSAHDAEAPGYTYLAADTGDLYVLLSPGVWSDPIPFKGDNGWTPRFGLYEFNSDTVLLEVLGFIGGTGNAPVLASPLGEASPRFFLSFTGYTTIPSNAINIKGRSGSPGLQGLPGRPFIIDSQGTDRSLYDDQSTGYTFLNPITGKVSFKLSAALADWSPYFQWKGANGAANVLSGGLKGPPGVILFATDPETIDNEWALRWDAVHKALGIGFILIHYTGSSNTFIGNASGNYDIPDSAAGGNTAVGANTLSALTDGSANSAVGLSAGHNILIGNSNSLLGHSAGSNITSGNRNTFIGDNAGSGNQIGSDNVAVGSLAAGGFGLKGDGNIFIGVLLFGVTTGNKNVMIGNNLIIQSPTSDGQLTIQNIIFGKGNTATGKNVSDGMIGIGTPDPTARLHVLGSTKLEGSVTLPVAGNGILIKEGENATMGIVTLVDGTATINTTMVTANSRISLDIQSLGTVTIPTTVGTASRIPGVSFTIISANPLDTSEISWIIFEPAP